MEKRNVNELNLIDDFMLQFTLSDEEYGVEAARLMLSILMERPIENVTIKTQEVWALSGSL